MANIRINIRCQNLSCSNDAIRTDFGNLPLCEHHARIWGKLHQRKERRLRDESGRHSDALFEINYEYDEAINELMTKQYVEDLVD